MWQRFTERARRTVFFAQEEAGRRGQNFVAPEHLLLGLVREDGTVAAKLLTLQNISLESVREKIDPGLTQSERRLGQDMQLTPDAKRTIDLAYDEAKQLGNAWIGTEHLLLGLIRQSETEAGRILAERGAELEKTRELLRQLQANDSSDEAPPKPKPKKKGLILGEITIPGVGFVKAGIGKEKDAEDTQEERGAMWQRFTERARRAVFFAQEEAGRLGENYISTEHLLLGLVRENDSVAARILDRMGVSLGRIRNEIERNVTRGDGKPGTDMQLTPRAKRVIDLAYDEARQLSNNYIGTEHLLLGLIREGQGLAGRVMAKLGMELEKTRREVMHIHSLDAFESSQTRPSDEIRQQFAEREKALPRNERVGIVSELIGLARRVMDGKPAEPTAKPEDAAKEEADILRDYITQAHPLWVKKSLISLMDVSEEQFLAILDVAAGLKALDLLRKPGIEWQYTRTLAMLFEKPSLRTRVSFEASMAHLRGHAINLAPGEVGLGTREPVADVAGVLSRWVDVIAVRVFTHETVVGLAEHGTIPVINALSDREHPIQALADLLTLREKVGPLGNEIKLAYVGDGNNVLHALLLACALTGVNLSVACPEGFQPLTEYVAKARELAEKSGANIAVGSDAKEAVRDADAVYTDVWTSMGQEEERDARLHLFMPYQINAELLAAAKPNALVLHCLPAHRGEEISAEVMDAHAATMYEQAENRLHTQKALLMLIIGL